MEEDFDAWYAELRPRLASALAAWCGDPEVASDAVDEAFVRAIERWDRVGQLDVPAGWVWRTATNVVRRRARRTSLERRSVDRATAGRPTEAGAAAGRGPALTDVDLRDALLQLTDRQRTAVVLHHIVDLPVAHVATAMGVATGTVSATLHQARCRLADLLADAPLTPTTTAPRADGAIP